jgi:hypothetical protein
MADTKVAWLSKTMWLNLIGGLAAAVSAFWPQANALTVFISTNLPMIGMGWGILGMIIRAITKDKIVLSD